MNKTAALVCLILVMTFALRAPGFFEKLSWDEGMYAYISSQVLEGKAPHRDMPGDKEAGIFFLYGFIFKTMGNNSLSVRLFGALWVTAAALLVFYMGRALFGIGGGLLSAFFFGLSMAGIKDAGMLTNSEVFMTLPSVLAYLLSLMAVRKGRAGYLFWCGLVLGFNFSLKVTAFLDVAGVLAFLFISSVFFRREGPALHALKGVALLFAGFVAALVPIVSYLAFKGALADAWEQTFLWRFSHMEQAYAGSTGGWGRFMAGYGPILIEEAGLVFAAALSAIYITTVDRKRDALLPVIWSMLSFSSIFITGRFPAYYFPFAIPALALLAGYGASRVSGGRPFGSKGVAWAAAGSYMAVSVALFAYPNAHYYREFLSGLGSIARGELTMDEYYRMIHPDVACAYDAADYVRENSSPSDRVFFWTSSGEFYWEAGRPRPTKYLQEILAGRNKEAEREHRERIYKDVSKNPPKFFVVRDIVMLNAIPPYRATETLESTKDLKTFLDNNYTLDKVFGRALVYRRVETPGGPRTRALAFFPEYMSPSVGYILHGDWFMYANGGMSQRFDMPGEHQASITVRAKGNRLFGEYPALRLKLDGKEIGSVRLDSPGWKEYPLGALVPAGPHELTLEYYNDAWDPKTKEGRDLFIGDIILRYGAS